MNKTTRHFVSKREKVTSSENCNLNFTSSALTLLSSGTTIRKANVVEAAISLGAVFTAASGAAGVSFSRCSYQRQSLMTGVKSAVLICGYCKYLTRLYRQLQPYGNNRPYLLQLRCGQRTNHTQHPHRQTQGMCLSLNYFDVPMFQPHQNRNEQISWCWRITKSVPSVVPVAANPRQMVLELVSLDHSMSRLLYICYTLSVLQFELYRILPSLRSCLYCHPNSNNIADTRWIIVCCDTRIFTEIICTSGQASSGVNILAVYNQ